MVHILGGLGLKGDLKNAGEATLRDAMGKWKLWCRKIGGRRNRLGAF